ncbi:hypothetical protein EDM57_04410 [Brevibacillus gelatini]|uniref:Uncharacterized protein n=1 Tax=Brevibacillus gelatini TaxID=1655277 RepID=A0A3M8B7G3_9BACL|nr:hypothetical protein [Brevibacillus gelatini]RNB59391.1 hypothetical protein EDM57_04410 [Brevibacillus gelatini]
MKLSEFIKQKEAELINSEKYRTVTFASAEEVGLFKNCVAMDFFSRPADLNREVKEINLSDLTEESSVTKTNNNGVSVVFGAIPKTKRKPIRKEFYALYV